MRIPKKLSSKDKKYLKYVKRECLIHPFETNVDPHHLIARGMGRGSKSSDYCAVGLCRECHQKIHKWGNNKFEIEMRVNLWYEAWKSVLKYIDEGGTVIGYEVTE